MIETLQQANLQDLSADNVKEQLQDLRARSHKDYDAEYGIRRDDAALVFHFFPPGYAAGQDSTWASWEGFRDRIEAAAACFEPDGIKGGYVEELRSFYLEVPRPPAFDLTALIEKFFAAV